jgi:hypothetical protein
VAGFLAMFSFACIGMVETPMFEAASRQRLRNGPVPNGGGTADRCCTAP